MQIPNSLSVLHNDSSATLWMM